MKIGWKANFLRPKKLIMWTMIGGAGYGIYLLVNYYTPPKSERLFKKIIANQIKVQTKGETANLEEMAESSGTSAFSPDELKLAQKNRLDADKKRKNLEVMLKKPETKTEKPVSAKPKEEVWIFVWMATDELMEKNPQQKPFSEYVTKNVICSEKELNFIRFEKGKYKDKIVLTRNESDEYYLGYVFNKIEKKYNPVRLFPEKGNFEGYIFTSKGSKIIATLKRQNHL